jgi:hypothetical protein
LDELGTRVHQDDLPRKFDSKSIECRDLPNDIAGNTSDCRHVQDDLIFAVTEELAQAGPKYRRVMKCDSLGNTKNGNALFVNELEFHSRYL